MAIPKSTTPFFFHINHAFILFLLLVTFLPPCFPAKFSYTDHCSSIVPFSARSSYSHDSTISLYLSDGHFSGGYKILGPVSESSIPGSFYFYPHTIFTTQNPENFQLDGHLNFQGRAMQSIFTNFSEGRRYRVSTYDSQTYVNFDLSGFWSKSTGKLCMVGPGSLQGTEISLSAVIKLNYPFGSNISTSLIHGMVQSLDASDSPRHFDAISVLGYSMNNYSYTKIDQVRNACSGVKVPGELLRIDANDACSFLRNIWDGRFLLEYGKNHGFSSKFMTLNQIRCTEDGKVNMLIGFTNSSNRYANVDTLNPGKSLVAEGFWDLEEKRMCLVACKILLNSSIGKCTIGLSLWFPAFFTIKNRNSVLGRIWSNKDKSDPDYFSMILFRSIDMHTLPDLKYKYAKSKIVRMSCDDNKDSNVGDERYPEGNSNMEDLKFELSVRNAQNNLMRGSAIPLSFGETFYGNTLFMDVPATASGFTLEEVKGSIRQRVWDVSYKIRFAFYNASLEADSITEISAEGIYNGKNGKFCMFGCRVPSFSDFSTTRKAEDSMDCEILINIQLSPLNHHDSENNGTMRHLNGTIKSTRKKYDPFYFDTLELSSYTIYNTEAHEMIQRMDMEIMMVLISLTLSCIFIIFQLSYVTKHRNVSPSISITMLVTLTLGHVIAPVLNIEALLANDGSNNNVLIWSGGWLEAYEIIARVMTILALFLHIRLLINVWFAKKSEENREDIEAAERKALRFCISFYSAAALIAMWIGYIPVWKDIIAYGGLMLDFFLLPQIIFNIIWNKKDKELSPLFYIGTSVVRALPHLYDTYRARYYAVYFNFSYIYANPCEGFYSTVWDTVVPLGFVMFVIILCLQQKFGGNFFLPEKFRKAFDETAPVINL